MNMAPSIDKHRIPLFEIATAAAVMIIIAVTTLLAYRTLDVQSTSYKNYSRASQIITTLKDLDLALVKAESGQRGYLLTKDEAYLEHYHSVIDDLGGHIRDASKLKSIFLDQQDRINTLVRLAKEKRDELRSTVKLGLDDQNRKAVRIVKSGSGAEVYNEISAILKVLHERELDYLDEVSLLNAKSERDARLLFFIAILVSSLLLATLLVILNSSLKKERANRLALRTKTNELEERVVERTKELVVYSEQLSRSNKELEDFAFVASHDLQEPLRKIRAFSDRIERSYKDRLDEKGVDYLRRLRNAASRMSSLIEDLLQFSRVKSRGKKFERVCLRDIVDHVIEDLEITIEDGNAIIDVNELPEIDADPTQMHQLFLNLLSNSIKFRQADNPPRITISHSIISVPKRDIEIRMHCISLVDNGIGFEQEYAEKIFMPFQRLHGRDEFKGTGIGLAICRKIVERHGGTIEVKSKPGLGTEFTILLPLETVDFDSQI